MLTLPITEQARWQEWNIICTIAKNNGFPLQIIHNLKNNLKLTSQKQSTLTQTQLKKWITFTHFSPHTHTHTHTHTQSHQFIQKYRLNITFRTCNTIYNQLFDRIPLNKINSSGIHIVQCKTCNKWYVGQNGRLIEITHREHMRCIKTNNPVSAYALHSLNNRHEYGNPERTLHFLKTCSRGKKMNCWESFYMEFL